MTDAELVEAVAVKYGIKYYDIDRSSELWVWAVLDNFEEWYIEKSNDEYFCVLNDDIDNAVISTSFSRAVLEAALKASRGECCTPLHRLPLRGCPRNGLRRYNRREPMTKHTALPWEVVIEDIGDETFIYAPVGIKGADGFDVVSYEGGFTPNSEWNLDVIKANADFIIRACNSHDELVEALKHIKSEYGYCLPEKTMQKINKAIAKAEGDWKDSLIERPEIGVKG